MFEDFVPGGSAAKSIEEAIVDQVTVTLPDGSKKQVDRGTPVLDFIRAQIGQGLGFAELLAGSNEMEIGAGVRVRVLNLETVISVKEYLGSEKDLAALPVLRRTLEESRKRSGH